MENGCGLAEFQAASHEHTQQMTSMAAIPRGRRTRTRIAGLQHGGKAHSERDWQDDLGCHITGSKLF